MKITDSQYDNRKNRFIVQTEDGSRFFLTYETVSEYQLYTGEEMDPSLLTSFVRETQKMVARDLLFSALTKRMLSSFECKKRLVAKEIDDDIIEETIAWFTEQKWIDDSVYLENAVKDQIHVKGYGLWRVISNLKQKGFDKGAIQNQYEELTTIESDASRARAYVDKKWPMIRGTSLLHRKKKLSDQLLTRGFSYDVISDVLEGLEE